MNIEVTDAIHSYETSTTMEQWTVHKMPKD
jgi:hypothetical protein